MTSSENPNKERWELEEKAEEFLLAARSQLPKKYDTYVYQSVPNGPLVGTLDEFNEFLNVGEPELAWDALETFAKSIKAPPATFVYLAAAAIFLNKPEKAIAVAKWTADTWPRA